MKLISVGNSKLKIQHPKRWRWWPRPNARRRKQKVFSTSVDCGFCVLGTAGDVVFLEH